MSKARNLCFTINNYSDSEIDALKAWNQVQYLVVGKEVGESGTKHLQGYVEFVSSKKFETIKKYLPRAHLEVRKGTAMQAANYCKKDGDFIEQGKISNQGKRTDIDVACDMIIAGRKMKDVALAHPSTYVKFHKGLTAFKSIILDPRNQVPTVTVLYGPTGVGKSKLAREMIEGDYYTWGPEQDKWFDGYEGQKIVIMEEFRGQLPFGMMLRLLDRYDCKVQYKGGMIEFVATTIILTSPKHPSEWYESLGNDKTDQLLRRITEIKSL